MWVVNGRNIGSFDSFLIVLISFFTDYLIKSGKKISVECEIFTRFHRTFLYRVLRTLWNYNHPFLVSLLFVPWEIVGNRIKFNPFVCVQCGKAYKNQTSLSRHIHHECGKLPKYSCPRCSKMFKRKDRIKTHLKEVHLYSMKGHEFF